MNAVELFHQDGRPAGVWYCGKCKCIVGDRTGGKDAAEKCCEPSKCEQCGAEVERYWRSCGECRRKNEVKREQERFALSKKLTLDEWGASDVCDNMLMHPTADKWFRDLDDFEEWLSCDSGRVRPSYLWCSEHIRWRPDASGDLRDRLHDNFHEDAADDISDDEYKRLDDMVNAWWQENRVISYEPDYSRCVLLAELSSDAAHEPADGHAPPKDEA